MTDLPALVVLVSGSGSNLQALIDAIAEGKLQARIAAVVSNKSDAYGLQRAIAAGIPTRLLIKRKEVDRETYDAQLAQIVHSYQPRLVVLAGWMRLLSMSFLRHFPGKVINLHPALPGTFPGTNAIERAYEAYSNGVVDHTGVMVHFVPDEGVDAGPVINSAVVPILAGDTLEVLEARIHACEHQLLVESVCQVINQNAEDA